MAVWFWYFRKSDTGVRYSTVAYKSRFTRYQKNTAMYNWSPCRYAHSFALFAYAEEKTYKKRFVGLEFIIPTSLTILNNYGLNSPPPRPPVIKFWSLPLHVLRCGCKLFCKKCLKPALRRYTSLSIFDASNIRFCSEKYFRKEAWLNWINQGVNRWYIS